MNRQVNTVRVMSDFPGFEEGSVLERYYDGSFVLLQDDGDDGYFIEETKAWRVSEDQVMKYLGTYFADITQYEMRTREEVENAILKVKESIENEVYDYDAVLVWKNLLYCLEWVIGRREYQIPVENENVSKENRG